MNRRTRLARTVLYIGTALAVAVAAASDDWHWWFVVPAALLLMSTAVAHDTATYRSHHRNNHK